MSTASSPRREPASAFHSGLQRFHRFLVTSPSQELTTDRPASDADSWRVEAAQVALAQALSPAERVHAIHQAQTAGLPLHEIEQQLDWAEARAATGMK